MRAVMIIALVLATSGCAGIRQTLGLYQKTADKGVTIGGSTAGGGTAPPGSAGSETTPAADRTASDAPKGKGPVLPGGLGGDKEHRAYTGDAPK